jgi:hypothetical protein
MVRTVTSYQTLDLSGHPSAPMSLTMAYITVFATTRSLAATTASYSCAYIAPPAYFDRRLHSVRSVCNCSCLSQVSTCSAASISCMRVRRGVAASETPHRLTTSVNRQPVFNTLHITDKPPAPSYTSRPRYRWSVNTNSLAQEGGRKGFYVGGWLAFAGLALTSCVVGKLLLLRPISLHSTIGHTLIGLSRVAARSSDVWSGARSFQDVLHSAHTVRQCIRDSLSKQ